jgi:hypothetical protein
MARLLLKFDSQILREIPIGSRPVTISAMNASTSAGSVPPRMPGAIDIT